MEPKFKTVFLTGLLLSINTPVAHAIQIEFDYSYDHSGFFDDPERREIMDVAASFYSGFTDNLSAITTDQNNSWEITFRAPGDYTYWATINDLNIAEDTIKVYVGGYSMGSGVLGYSMPSYVTVNGSQEFSENIQTRGQENALGPDATDFGTWGGVVSFNSDANWHFGADTNGLDSSKSDFLTTATHEIAHILGYGEAASWFNKIDNNYFYGEHSMAAYGGPVPTQFDAHWDYGVMSYYNGVPQETMMDPNTPRGERQLPTDLDYTGFQDIGWQIAPVPEPSTLAMFGLGLGLLGLRFRKKIA